MKNLIIITSILMALFATMDVLEYFQLTVEEVLENIE